MTTGRAIALVLVLAASSPARAHAQEDAHPHAREDEDAAAAERLADERMRQRAERWEEGMGLIIYGATSAIAGGVIAAVGHQDERLLWAGLGTAAWGLINIPFGIPMLDPSGGELRRIDEERSLRGEALRLRREDAARDQYGSAAVFAFNGGLDVFYIATGVLLAVLGEVLEPEIPGMTGYGVAMGIQGVGLLAYDLAGWIRAAERGTRLLTLERDEESDE
jgi:hypothetical protein